MELNDLENEYRVLEADFIHLKDLRSKANTQEDKLFWYLEMEATKREMKKVAISFDQLYRDKLPKAA